MVAVFLLSCVRQQGVRAQLSNWTKRVVRAILKAADICAADPERAARRLVDGGFAERYDYALQTLTELPYDRWRHFDPEDSMRFYALRLHEVGMIKSSPNAILAGGTDWRFLNELKRELKALSTGRRPSGQNARAPAPCLGPRSAAERRGGPRR